MNSGLLKTCAIFFLAFSPVAVKSQQPAPDVILLNGKIFTSDAAHPYVQALALEEAVEKLPDAYRTIFILRDIEEMSTTDAAEVLEITEDNVKVRLHRARALLRKSLYARAGMERKEAFTFHAVRCDRVVKNVFERIQQRVSKTGSVDPRSN